MLRFAIAAKLLLLVSSASAVAADESNTAFNTHCRNCHSVKKGDNRLGPSMFAIAGAKAGQAEGYRGYSGSLKDFVWDEATLDRFIANPSSISPSTNMIYPPVADAEERRKIISYLKEQSGP